MRLRLIIINRWLLLKLASMILILVLLFSFSNLVYTDAINSYRLPMKNKIIIIDPGHGGVDPGAVSRTGVTEDDINLRIALKLRRLIEQSGGVALMIREDDSGLYSDGRTRIRDKKNEDLRTRHELINSSGADIFISVHLNSFPQSQYYGAQSFYQKGDEEGKKIAELIQNELIEVIKNQNIRKAKSIDTVYILKNKKMPGALVECGFLSNSREEKLLQEDKYQDKIAWGIFMGIMRYFEGN
ncbi:MAG: N-acetylmuramoyl-L-alanine amidase CwlD, partial [Lutispora sp.]|nr:N-acetylmuramoyl-L-alanine amidase CwlD [Lutispora sp.]